MRIHTTPRHRHVWNDTVSSFWTYFIQWYTEEILRTTYGQLTWNMFVDGSEARVTFVKFTKWTYATRRFFVVVLAKNTWNDAKMSNFLLHVTVVWWTRGMRDLLRSQWPNARSHRLAFLPFSIPTRVPTVITTYLVPDPESVQFVFGRLRVVRRLLTRLYFSNSFLLQQLLPLGFPFERHVPLVFFSRVLLYLIRNEQSWSIGHNN